MTDLNQQTRMRRERSRSARRDRGAGRVLLMSRQFGAIILATLNGWFSLSQRLDLQWLSAARVTPEELVWIDSQCAVPRSPSGAHQSRDQIDRSELAV